MATAAAAALVLVVLSLSHCSAAAAAHHAHPPGFVVKSGDPDPPLKPPPPGHGAHLAGPDRFVQLRFYFHDRLLVPNATSFFVVPPLAGLPTVFQGADLFGAIVVFDNVLTVGPELDSLEVGRARGFYVRDTLTDTESSIELVYTAVFNDASGFPGSTLQIRGANLSPLRVREISVVGGTGEFRLARGWANNSVYSREGNGFDVTLNYTVSVFYGGSGRYA